MTSKKTKIAGLLAISLIILLTLGILPSLSVISITPDVQFTDGIVRHITTITIDKGTELTYVLKGEPYTLPNGSIVTPTRQETVTFTPEPFKCNYKLTATPEPYINLIDMNLNLWNYYSAFSPSLVAKTKISSSAATIGGIKIYSYLDMAQIGATTIILDTDGKGKAVVQTKGVLGGVNNCPDTSGVIFLKDQYGNPKPVDKASYIQYSQIKIRDASLVCTAYCINPLLLNSCISCISNTLSDLKHGEGIQPAANFEGMCKSLAFTDPTGTEIKSGVTCVAEEYLFSNGLATITADQDFVDSVIVAPQVLSEAIPKSMSPTTFNSGQSNTVRFIFENIKSTTDVFQYTLSSNIGTFSSPRGNVQIYANSEAPVDVTYSIPSMTTNTNYEITAKICSISAEYGEKCNIKTFNANALKYEQFNPPTNSCPNGICEPHLGETTSTCPQDCHVQQVSCSDIPNSHEVDNACICNTGFETKYDPLTGKQTCTKPLDWIIIGIIGLGITTVVLLIAVVYRATGKRGRRR